MRSDDTTKGYERAASRSLMYATGVDPSQIGKPMIGIASSFSDLIPGHTGMRDLERFIEKGIHTGGGSSSFSVYPVFATVLQWDTAV